MSRVLITGGAGFIGSHLAEALLEAGQEVAVIDDLSTGSLENIRHLMERPGFTMSVETIMNETVMDRLVSECDVIYHLAAAVGVELIVSRPVDVIKTNIFGTEMVLKLANRYLKKVLITSTSEIYGKNTKVPFREEDDRLLGPTTRSRWSYSDSKAIEEFLSLAYHKERGLGVIIVRLFNTVGPRQTGRYGMVVPRFVRQALGGEPITVYGSGEQVRCFTHVRDVVEAMRRLIEHPEAVGEIYNFGATEPLSIGALAERIIELTGSSSRVEYIPYENAYEEGFEDMITRVPDCSKFEALTGFSPRAGLDETLREIIEYERVRGV